ncbi:MAG: hypothetical protein DIU80_001525 [Chloroflexota bacterium]|nr:MAG: hypothetical protein DIU80_03950 [Chloroflexota bacterium]
MVTTTVDAEKTRRLLWSHIAHQVISTLPAYETCELVGVGTGWGLRRINDHRRAILIHPTIEGHEIGELSLTVCGEGTQIIPRCNNDFIRYFHTVSDVVETVAHAHLLD